MLFHSFVFSSSGAIHMMDMEKCITTTTMVHPTNIMIATMNQCTERLMKKQLFINQNHINQNHTNQNHLISQNQAILRLWYRKWNQPKIYFKKFTLDIIFAFQKRVKYKYSIFECHKVNEKIKKTFISISWNIILFIQVIWKNKTKKISKSYLIHIHIVITPLQIKHVKLRYTNCWFQNTTEIDIRNKFIKWQNKKS